MMASVNRLNSSSLTPPPQVPKKTPCSLYLLFQTHVLSCSPPEPLMKLGHYVWKLTLRAVDLISSLFTYAVTPQKHDPQVFSGLMSDFELKLAGYESTLLAMRNDVKKLVIQHEKQLGQFLTIHEEKEKNEALLRYLKKTCTLNADEEKKLVCLLNSCEEITALLKQQVALSVEPIKKVFQEIEDNFNAKGLDSPDIALHDLNTYLAYQSCLALYTNEIPKNAALAQQVQTAIESKKLLQRKPEVSVNLPKGLANIGNSCYIASTVQALLASPRLKERFALPLVQKEKETNQRFEERVAIQQAFQNLAASLSDLSDSTVSLESFRQAIFSNKTLNHELTIWARGGETRKSPCPLAQQHDAAELMMLLLEVIDYHVDIQENWWVEGQPLPDEPVAQPNQLLEIEISGAKPLQMLIDEAFAKKEYTDRENKRRMEKGKCVIGEFESWCEQLRLLSQPDTVVIHLKRFVNKGWLTKKVTDPVSLPPNRKILLNGESYKLTATVRHSGWLNGGHYIAHVEQTGLIQCNDDRVSLLSEKEWGVDNSFQNYLLIFERA